MISEVVTISSLSENWHITKMAGTPYLTTNEDDSPANVQAFQTMVGSLLLIARMWRPDIQYAVNRLCIKVSSPNNTDVRRGCRIMSYLLKTKYEGTMLRVMEDSMDIFTDAGEENLEEKATT